MKPIILLSAILLLLNSCGQQNADIQRLQTEINELHNKIDSAYRPGLGEFMSGIQVHHAKLWFAGKEQNWKLATFEINEISEAIDDIRQYNSDRPEVKSISMISPAIDSMNNAISQKSPELFNRSFLMLTNTCNNCHQTTNHAFNVIKIPDAPPFSNQVFKPQ